MMFTAWPDLYVTTVLARLNWSAEENIYINKKFEVQWIILQIWTICALQEVPGRDHFASYLQPLEWYLWF